MHEEVGVVGLVLYGFVLAMLGAMRLWLYSYRCCRECAHVRRSLPCSSPKNLFFLFSVFFLLCRLAWFGTATWSPEHVSDYILNRVAFALFFTAFTLVIFFWADTLHTMHRLPVRQAGQQHEDVFFHSWIARIAFVVINLLMYVAELSFIIHFAIYANGKREGTLPYDINILIVVALFGLICMAFLSYGIGLLVVTRKARNTKSKIKFYIQTILVTIVLVFCFSARFAIFLYRPISATYMDPWLFISLAYFVPELVPIVLMGTVLSLSLHKQILIRYDIEKLSYGRLNERSLSQALYADDSSASDPEDAPPNLSLGINSA